MPNIATYSLQLAGLRSGRSCDSYIQQLFKDILGYPRPSRFGLDELLVRDKGQEVSEEIMNEWNFKKIKFVIFCICFCLFSIISFFWTIDALASVYSVWSSRKVGEAELAKAESNRQIKTLEAKAAEESAKHLANAEIIRAQGVAQANLIIGQSLKENEAYLRYLWVNGLQHTQNQVIYIPTETNLPILEANRMK